MRGRVDSFWGGFGLQRGHFSVKMYAKMKELGPVGGACAGMPPIDLPMTLQYHAFRLDLYFYGFVHIYQMKLCILSLVCLD